MNTSQIFIVISIVTLAIVAILFLAARKNKKKLTPLAGLAWAFVLAGIIFGEDRLIGYGLMGVGVVLALIDMFIQSKRKQPDHALLKIIYVRPEMDDGHLEQSGQA